MCLDTILLLVSQAVQCLFSDLKHLVHKIYLLGNNCEAAGGTHFASASRHRFGKAITFKRIKDKKKYLLSNVQTTTPDECH